ncbi:unnamed protein product [Amoebophrya sp. A120]|nr:unnamed protein product [Amoebophrya sp. A120]|eukprot:GSA120T00009416001.1
MKTSKMPDLPAEDMQQEASNGKKKPPTGVPSDEDQLPSPNTVLSPATKRRKTEENIAVQPVVVQQLDPQSLAGPTVQASSSTSAFPTATTPPTTNSEEQPPVNKTTAGTAATTLQGQPPASTSGTVENKNDPTETNKGDELESESFVVIDKADDPYAQLHLVDDDDPSELPHCTKESVFWDQMSESMAGFPAAKTADKSNANYAWIYQYEEKCYFRNSDGLIYVENLESKQPKGVVLKGEPEMERLIGVCCKWNGSKGFGFLKVSEFEDEVFVHHKQLRLNSKKFQKLEVEDRVSFVPEQDKAGRWCASDVQYDYTGEEEEDENAMEIDVEDEPMLVTEDGRPPKTNVQLASEGGDMESARSGPGASKKSSGEDESESGEELNIKRSLVCHYHTEMGPMKQENQDRYCEKRALPNMKSDDAELFYFSVFDGHNGSACAQYSKEQLDKNICAAVNQISHTHPTPKDFANAHKAGFKTTDSNWLHKAAKEGDASGACAVTTLFYGPDEQGELSLFTAHAGDSFAVLCRDGKAIRLTSDHKPNRQDERNRIEETVKRTPDLNGLVQQCNGVWRVLIQAPAPLGVPAHLAQPNYMGLAVSRAIGDLPFKEPDLTNVKTHLVSGVPEVRHTSIDREEDDFLVLGSDGITDVMSDQMICDVIAMERNNLAFGKASNKVEQKDITKRCRENIAQKIIEIARDRGSQDDCTCVICFFQWCGDAPEEEEEDNFSEDFQSVENSNGGNGPGNSGFGGGSAPEEPSNNSPGEDEDPGEDGDGEGNNKDVGGARADEQPGEEIFNAGTATAFSTSSSIIRRLSDQQNNYPRSQLLQEEEEEGRQPSSAAQINKPKGAASQRSRRSSQNDELSKNESKSNRMEEEEDDKKSESVSSDFDSQDEDIDKEIREKKTRKKQRKLERKASELTLEEKMNAAAREQDMDDKTRIRVPPGAGEGENGSASSSSSATTVAREAVHFPETFFQRTRSASSSAMYPR